MQNIPVVLAVSQSSLPHAQTNGFGAEPSAVAQVAAFANLRHLFWDR